MQDNAMTCEPRSELSFPAPITEATRQALAGGFPLLIDGRFVDAASGRTAATCDPATGARIADFAMGGTEDVDRAVQAAARAFEGPWSRLSHFERARLLRRLAGLIEANADLLAELDTIDNGMPIGVSRMIGRK